MQTLFTSVKINPKDSTSAKVWDSTCKMAGYWRTRDGKVAKVLTYRDGRLFGLVAIDDKTTRETIWMVDGDHIHNPSLDLVELKRYEAKWNIPQCLKDEAGR